MAHEPHEKLEAAITGGHVFGSSDEDRLVSLSADVLRDVIDRLGSQGSGHILWLRRTRVEGELGLEGESLEMRLHFEQCHFGSPIVFRQLRGSEVVFQGCSLTGGFRGDQLSLRWNLRFDDCTVAKGIRLPAAKIGGQLSLTGATITSAKGADGLGAGALTGDGLEVAGDMIASKKLIALGGIRLPGAKIGGHLHLNGAGLVGARDSEGRILHPALLANGIEVRGRMRCADGFVAIGQMQMVGAKIGAELSLEDATLVGGHGEQRLLPALNADGMRIGGGFLCDRLKTSGEMRLLGAEIGDVFALTDAQIENWPDLDEPPDKALSCDRAVVAGGLFFNGLSTTGEARLLGADIGGQISLKGATLTAGRPGEATTCPALVADGVRVARGIFCTSGFSSSGEVRLLAAEVGGQIAMDGADLKGGEDSAGSPRPALNCDRAEVTGNVFLSEGFTARGEVRILGGKVDGLLMMDDAKLSGSDSDDSESGPVFSAEGAEIAGDFLCGAGFQAAGAVKLNGVQIGGQFGLNGAALTNHERALEMVGATVDELIVSLRRVDGVLDLRDTRVRSLWDAKDGRLVGRLPPRLELQGFKYESLREPLDAKKRLRWIERSQQDTHFPDVYAELAEAFRRIGRRADARKVGIANERRARNDLSKRNLRRPLHDFLWITVGYGYRNWLAGIWLLVLIACGSIAFSRGEESFEEANRLAPPFEPVIYAVDSTVPVLELSQTRWWSATGCMSFVELFLAVMGYALVAAVVAAAAGLFNRDHV